MWMLMGLRLLMVAGAGLLVGVLFGVPWAGLSASLALYLGLQLSSLLRVLAWLRADLELTTKLIKDGKAYVALGAYAVDGTYKVEGDKIVARGDFGPMLPSPLVFTINKDGTIDGPRNSMIPRLERAK